MKGTVKNSKDGDYTIKVALTSVGTPLPFGQTAELTTQVTVDTKVPEVTISN